MNESDIPQEKQSHLGAEYRYSCFIERRAPYCELLADTLGAQRRERFRSIRIHEFACNGLKHGPSCYEVSVDYLLSNYSGFWKKPQPRWAFDYFGYGCDHGHSQSCYRKGQMMIQPKGTYKRVKSNPTKGMELLESACNKGSFDACYEASVHFLTGKIPGVPVDYRKAFLLSKTACEFGYHANACHNLAAMYENGIATKKNPNAAKQIREKMASQAKSK